MSGHREGPEPLFVLLAAYYKVSFQGIDKRGLEVNVGFLSAELVRIVDYLYTPMGYRIISNWTSYK